MAILTITKQYGSGGGEIGQAVATLLGYEYIPLKRVYEEARNASGSVKKIAEIIGDGIPGLWERNDWSFLAFTAFSEDTIMTYALRNNVVIMTRGGNVLMQGIPHALRVLMVAPLETRVDRIVEWDEGLNREIATMMVKKADRAMAVTIQQEYGANWTDPEGYDLVLDTSRQERDFIVTLLQNALKEKDKSYSEPALKILTMKALAAKVKAGIATNPHFMIPTLEVSAKEDRLIVRGIVRTPEQHKKIEEEIRRIAGETPVECHLHYRGTWPFRGI